MSDEAPQVPQEVLDVLNQAAPPVQPEQPETPPEQPAAPPVQNEAPIVPHQNAVINAISEAINVAEDVAPVVAAINPAIGAELGLAIMVLNALAAMDGWLMAIPESLGQQGLKAEIANLRNNLTQQ